MGDTIEPTLRERVARVYWDVLVLTGWPNDSLAWDKIPLAQKEPLLRATDAAIAEVSRAWRSRKKRRAREEGGEG